jgi:microcystin-dependent protein
MAENYVGEIRMFGGNFAPAGWMFCEGQLLPISEYETLFNLIGTTYGGDGQETFALPDLRGRLPLHQGTQGGITYTIAESGGTDEVTLTVQQIPNHTHPMVVSQDPASSPNPQNNVLANPASATPYSVNNPNIQLASQAITPAGGSQPHTNLQPYTCVNFIIALFGIYPTPT